MLARGEPCHPKVENSLRVMRMSVEEIPVANESDIQTNSLKEEKKEELVQLLNDFGDCFANGFINLECTDTDKFL